jgi:hypothetical protein
MQHIIADGWDATLHGSQPFLVLHQLHKEVTQ